MVIRNLNVAWPVKFPPEADPPLQVDPNTVLPSPVAAKRLQPIARQPRQVLERLGTVQQREPARSLVGESLEPWNTVTLEEPPRVPILEASDHERP